MKVNFAQLNQEEQRVMARLKATLALRLAEEAWRADPGLRAGSPARGVAMKIALGGAGPSIPLDIPASDSLGDTRGGSAPNSAPSSALSRRPALALYFPSAVAAMKVLSGAKGLAIPLPLGAGAFGALAFFRRASSRATEMLRDPATPGNIKARLLLAATLFGLEAIAGESYLARRMHIVPDGAVRVSVEEIEYFVVKNGNSIRVLRTVAGSSAPVHADAELSFSDCRSAIEVLSGARQAVIALGSGQVRIEGLLPLVQGLFAVLDRLSWYMGVEL